MPPVHAACVTVAGGGDAGAGDEDPPPLRPRLMLIGGAFGSAIGGTGMLGRGGEGASGCEGCVDAGATAVA